jgi:hypothetical protein
VMRARWIRIGIYLACLVFLLIYGKLYYPAVTLPMCLKNPDKYDGLEIGVGSEAKVVSVTDGWFTIRQLGVEVEVRGSAPDIRPDEYIIMEAVFHREGWLEMTRVYVAVQRRYKIFISVAPVVVVFILLVFTYRFNFSTMEFQERRLWRT